ncbi:MAG TPA: hypothetical protein VE869_09890, partial [Gemmatimonas sp.]|nr:hypothetical protein [Gemmatimonas sp.]
MASTEFSQLGFDFDGAAPSGHAIVREAPVAVPDPAPGARLHGEPQPDINWVGGGAHTGPARGRAAVRARTAVLFSRLQGLGLRGIEVLVLMRTRTVMVSLIGRTLR